MFVAALRKLAEKSIDALNDALRDRLVWGLKNEADLTLEKAINVNVIMEMASKEAQQL